MVRLFTLMIPYRSKEYVALVSMQQQADKLLCQVHYVDNGLPCLVPGDDLVISINGDLNVPAHCPDGLTKNLAAYTLHAVSDYLNAVKKQQQLFQIPILHLAKTKAHRCPMKITIQRVTII